MLNSHHRLINTTQNCSEWERKAISNFEECATMSQRIEELQKRLATPVRLPNPGTGNDPYSLGRDDVLHCVASDLRKLGFTVERDE